MRLLLAGTAAAVFAFAATPAFAQYGGTPQQQVDRTPQASPDDEDADQAVLPDGDAQADDEDSGGVAGGGKPMAGSDDEMSATADVDADADVDVDQGDVNADVDADVNVDQGDVDSDVDADADSDQGDVDADDQGTVDEDRAAPGDGGVAGGGYQGQTWQAENGQVYCRRSDGSTGLIVGGGAGALVGRGIDGGRHRGTGTIIGAIAGAAVGSAIERSANQQRCQ
jgi:hypothetical protein